jgi:hypothetical protein
LIFSLWGFEKGPSHKGQGVSVQRLSLGSGKRDLLQLTIDKPQRWGIFVFSKITGESLRLEIKATNISPLVSKVNSLGPWTRGKSSLPLHGTDQLPSHLEAPLIKMIALANSSHQLVQRADPELGRDCWICLRANQVSYVRVGLTNMSEIHELGLDNSIQNDNTCLTGPTVQLTRETECFGNGTNCTNLVKGTKAPNGTYFACQGGICTCYPGGSCALVFLILDLDIIQGLKLLDT